jgi:hypothetical protein
MFQRSQFSVSLVADYSSEMHQREQTYSILDGMNFSKAELMLLWIPLP